MKKAPNLLLSAIIIVAIYIISDYLYSLYNSNYTIFSHIHFHSKIFIELLFIIVAVLLIDNRYLKYTILIFISLIEMVEYLHFQYFGVPIQSIEFYQVYINTGEVFLSFFSAYKEMIIPLLISISSLFVILYIAKSTKTYKFKYKNFLIFILIILPIMYDLFLTYKNFQLKDGKLWHKQAKKILPMTGYISVENFSRAVKYFFIEILPKKLSSNKNSLNFPSLNAPKVKIKNSDINIVFIIGESLRAKSFSLLNKDKNKTTPKLSKIDNLIVKKIFSSGVMTKSSVSAILNRVKYPGATAQMVSFNNNLFKLAKDNGFKTYFISAQKDYQLNILDNYIGKKYIDFYTSRTKLEKKNPNLSKYDDILLKELKKIDLSKGHNFIVMQQRGSHSPYNKQYPKEYNKFKNPYLNTVLYTDNILTKIIEYLKLHSTKPTYFIYTSDHGELLQEYGKNGHGWLYKEVYEVPFLCYAINNNLNLKNDFKNIQSHFDVSNLVAKLLGYNLDIKHLEDIYVNGSDIDGLAGYLHIKVDTNNSIISTKKILP